MGIVIQSIDYFWEDSCPNCQEAERDLPMLERRYDVSKHKVRSVDGDPGFYLVGEDGQHITELRGVPAIVVSFIEDKSPVCMIGRDCVVATLSYLKYSGEDE